MKPPLLRANPFPVEAWFERSCALTFAVPQDEVARRLPRGLVPDTFAERWGFVTVAVVQTRHLRPAGFPRFLGSDFVLVGYRFFVRCTLASGRTLRGLYILRSETDRRRMERLGNFFTRYRYMHTPVRVREQAPRLTVSDERGGLRIALDLTSEPAPELPAGSPFADWREARRYCGPMPFTFSVDEAHHEVRIVEGLREDWHPRPVRVLEHHVPHLHTLGFPDAILANAFAVENIPYRWARGRTEALAPT
jgi:Uncharacterized conserved protein (COG2071).